MSRFGPDPHAFFDTMYQEIPPWDVGGPQPALFTLFNAYPPLGPVLDVGCGSGDLSIALAQSGLQVLGVDFVKTALNQAHQKAKTLPLEVAQLLDFQIGDALQPARLQQQFGSVVDSGFSHLFEPEVCDQFVEELALVLRPGGRYYLLAFAIDFEMPQCPRPISEVEVRERFTVDKGWQILDIYEAQFLTQMPSVPATCACVERLPVAQA